MAQLLAFGRRGAAAPLLLLYGPLVEGQTITAPAYSVLFNLPSRSTPLVEMRQAPDKSWKAARAGLRVSAPRMDAGHHLHEGLTLTNKGKPKP